MELSPQEVYRVRERILKINGGIGSNPNEQNVAKASGVNNEIISRIKQGIKLFEKSTQSSLTSMFCSSVDTLENAASKGFLLQWYSVMGGDTELPELALQDKAILQEFALQQTEKSGKNALLEIGKALSGIIEQIETVNDQSLNVIVATAIFIECEKYKEYPEVIGICVAAKSYISDKDTQKVNFDDLINEVFPMILGTIVPIALLASASPIAFAVNMAISTGAIMQIVSAIFALTIATVASKQIIIAIIKCHSSVTEEVCEYEEYNYVDDDDEDDEYETTIRV